MKPVLTPEELLQDPAHGLVPAARPAQLRLAAFLKETLHSKTPAAVEAGTGVGKSYGYLTHAMHLATTEKQTIIVSTAMKSLQQQIFFKDLPTLEQYYPDVDYARRLGKANYACKRKVHLHVENASELRTYAKFFDNTLHWVWADAPEGVTLPRNYMQHSVAHCTKTRCDWYDECQTTGYLNAKEAMDTAKILVVNHALVAADMRVHRMHGIDILPDATHLIVDEAHKFVEQVRDALGCALKEKYFKYTNNKYQEALGHSEGLAQGEAQRYLACVPEHLPDLAVLQGAYEDMFWEARQTRSLGPRAQHFALQARKTLRQLEPLVAVSPELLDTHAGPVVHELQTYNDQLEAFASAIDHTSEDRLRHVLAVAENSLTITPLDVSRDLTQYYERRGLTPTYLSATLTVNDKFDHFARDVGLRSTPEKPVRAKMLGSPFDYAKQAWGYFPTHLPLIPKGGAAPAELEAYYSAMCDEIYELLMANEGHAFILLTSRTDLETYATLLRKKNYPYPLLVQNDEMKASARAQFLATPHATLLGLKTFWEGIDIPGLQLSLVIIPKFPFPNPNDAVMQAKVKLAEDGFRQVQLPHMITDLKQMAGRLIRSMTDLGVVAVLDSRGSTKSYGADAVKAVGFPKWGSSKAQALKTLARVTEIRKQRKELETA